MSEQNTARAFERRIDEVVSRGRLSMRARRARLRTKGYQVGQCALAAGLAYLIAHQVLGHQAPFFAPIAAVVSLGTSYGQRLRRVVEVTFGVAIGVFLADLLAVWLGGGWWQLTLVVGLAMGTAVVLDTGVLFVNQAAVQSIVAITLSPAPGAGLTRWTDALVGGAVALVAATVVPRAPLRRPREQAARVMSKIASLLRAASTVMTEGDAEYALEVLADARTTDTMIRELQDAASEGLSIVASSPFRVRHKAPVRLMAELTAPLDRAVRNTRVLVRRTAVAAHHREPVPRAYAQLCLDLGDAADLVADELRADRLAVAAQAALLALGEATGTVERSAALSSEVVLAQLRSIVVDLLQITGMSVLEATDALPPPPR